MTHFQFQGQHWTLALPTHSEPTPSETANSFTLSSILSLHSYRMFTAHYTTALQPKFSQKQTNTSVNIHTHQFSNKTYSQNRATPVISSFSLPNNNPPQKEKNNFKHIGKDLE